MPNIFEDFDELATSAKGAYNATRLRMADPEKRRQLEEEMLQERRGRKRKRMFEGLSEGAGARDADEAFDLREALDPNAAMRRREREAGLGDTMEEFVEKQNRVRQIVQKRQQGEPVSKQEKILAFEVLTDIMKGLLGQRERELEKKYGPAAETEEPSRDMMLEGQLMEQSQMPPVGDSVRPGATPSDQRRRP